MNRRSGDRQPAKWRGGRSRPSRNGVRGSLPLLSGGAVHRPSVTTPSAVFSSCSSSHPGSAAQTLTVGTDDISAFCHRTSSSGESGSANGARPCKGDASVVRCAGVSKAAARQPGKTRATTSAKSQRDMRASLCARENLRRPVHEQPRRCPRLLSVVPPIPRLPTQRRARRVTDGIRGTCLPVCARPRHTGCSAAPVHR